MYKWGTPVREKTRWMGHELEDGNQNNMSNQHTSKISPSMLAIEVSIKGHACSESYGYQLAGCEGCPKKSGGHIGATMKKNIYCALKGIKWYT